MDCKKIKQLKEISRSGKYTKELNLVKWGNRPEKLDLRVWQDDTYLKGITLSDDEAKLLLVSLAKYYKCSIDKNFAKEVEEKNIKLDLNDPLIKDQISLDDIE